MEADNEKAWSEFVFSKNEVAFYALYTHYFKYLTYIGLKNGFSLNAVKDAINDLFLYLWESRDTLKDIKSPHNYAITAYLRKLYKKDNIANEDITDLKEYAALLIQPSVEIQFMHTQRQQEVSRILKVFVDELPEKQRQMIFQKFYLGLSYKEIAEVNEVSINTVYNTIYTAVDRLKNRIGKDNLHTLLLGVVIFCILGFIFFAEH